MMAFCATSCIIPGSTGKGTAKEDGKVSYNGTYVFTYSGGELASGHDNKLEIHSTSSTKDVFPIDFYIELAGDDYKVKDTGEYSGSISSGSTLTIEDLYVSAGSGKMSVNGKLTINKLDVNNDGTKSGSATYNFS
ncbi:MAG: hypothetical protein J6A30_01195 [Ruminococcus sp.]|nr:hypothetical protein [Ruminococcus sp.]